MIAEVSPWVGGLAGLFTALFWAASATVWGMATRRAEVPAISLAAMRAMLASLILLVIHRILFGTFWPSDMHGETMLLLAFSALLSITLGDLGFFYGIAFIGPRLVMLLFSLAPILTTLIAWFVLGEVLSLRALAGIVAVVGGVAWVVSEQRGQLSWGGDPARFRVGVLLALSATLLLAISYVISRAAMTGARITEGLPLPAVDSYSAAVVRVVAATLQGWLLLPLFGAVRITLGAFTNRRLLPLALVGTTVGMVLGVWTSMITLKYAPSGVGSALMSVSPVFMLPLSALVFGERHSARAVTGTVIAVAGIFLLLI